MKIINKQQIESSINFHQALEYIHQGFLKANNGEVTLPPVGTLSLEKGSIHIKYGYIKGDDFFYVKHSTGFSSNVSQGLPTSDGCILAYNANTGILEYILLDQGYLTHIRTALAASVVIRAYKKNPKCISILGSGAQAFYQAKVQHMLFPDAQIKQWGRHEEKIKKYNRELHKENIQTTIEKSLKSCFETSDVIISVTAARAFFIPADLVQKDMLIIAMGADEKGKQELDPNLLLTSDHILVDDLKQCCLYGELQHITANQRRHLNILNIGEYIEQYQGEHTFKGKVIADLTGIAAQDIQISNTLLLKKSLPLLYHQG